MKLLTCGLVWLLAISLFAQTDKGAAPLKTQNSPLETGSTYAVVVGISNYQDEGIPDLQFADKDAEAFAEWLQSPAGGAIPSDRIVVLQNEKATNARMADALIWMLETTQPGDKAIIYFSGHGDVETITRFNRGYLLTYDSPPKIYMAGAFNIRDLQDIISTLSNNEVQVIMISDACRAGKLAGTEIGGTQATAQNLSQQFANEVKILSCQPNEFSLEGEQWGGGRGAFSYHLLDGLQGLADKNGDARVSLFEIGRYLEDWVPTETAPHNQMPFTVGDRNTLLATVDKTVLAQLRRQKANDQPQLAQIETKGMEELVLAKVDTSIQLLYSAFKAALVHNQLLEPAGASAYELYQQLSQKEEIKDLHNIMRRNLSVALQEDAQQAVNAYLAANPVELERRYKSEQDYSLYPRYLEKACELLGPGHFYYNNLMAKRYYFEGLGLRMQGEQAGWTSRDSFYQVAVQLQRKALEFQEEAPFIFNELGVLYTLLRMDDQAFKYLDQAIEIAPNWGLPYVNYCVGSYYTGDLEKAREMGEKAVERMPDYPQVYNFLGWIYADYGSYVKDKSNWNRRGVELKGQFFYDWDNMGTLSQKKKARFQRTTELLKKATEVDSTYLDAHHNLGTVYANTGEYEAAVPYLQKAIEINAKDDFAWAMLGSAYQGLKEFQKGELAYKKAIALTIQDNPEIAAVWRNSLSILYGSWGKEDLAIEQLKKAIALNKNYPLPYGNLSDWYLNRKDLKLAEYYGLEYLRLNSDYPGSYHHLGVIYQQMCRFEDAEWMYLKAIELNPRYVLAFNQLLNLYSETQQYQKAQMVLQKAYEADPENIAFLVGLEITSFHIGDQYNANQYAEKVDEFIQEDAATINELAIQYHLGNYLTRAIYFFKKALELEPENLDPPYNLACGYALSGDSQNAIKWLSEALAKGYRNFEHIYQDPDLAGIRNEPAFQELMDQYFPGQVCKNPATSTNAPPSSEPLYSGENCMLLAQIFEHQEKDYERAEDLLEKAIALDPSNESVAITYLAFTIKSGKHKNALRVASNYLDAQNDTLQCFIAVAFYNNREFEKAETHFEKAYSLAPENYLWVSAIGGFYMMHDEQTLAEKYLRRAIAIETGMTFASGRLAILYYASGRKQEAYQILDDLLNSGKVDNSDFLLKAFLHWQSDEKDLAREVLMRTKMKWAPYGQVLDFLDLAEKKDYEGASAAYQAFLKRFEWSLGRTYIDYLFCELLVRQGKLQQAMDVFESILEQSFGLLTLSYPVFHSDPDLAPLRKMERYGELMQQYFPEKTGL